MASGPSDKSRGVAFVLALVLGVFGAHRFYAGKIGTGLAMLFTAGGLGIWYLVDVIMIAGGSFTDADGRRILRWNPDEGDAMAQVPAEVLDELHALREEVNELANRLDFAERLLADPTRRAAGSPDRT